MGQVINFAEWREEYMGKVGSGGGGFTRTFTRRTVASNFNSGDLVLRPDADKRSVKLKKDAAEARLKKRGALGEKQVFDYDKNVGKVVRVNADGTIRIQVRRGNEGLIADLTGRSKPRRSRTVKYIDVDPSTLKGATLRRAKENLEYKLV